MSAGKVFEALMRFKDSQHSQKIKEKEETIRLLSFLVKRYEEVSQKMIPGWKESNTDFLFPKEKS